MARMLCWLILVVTKWFCKHLLLASEDAATITMLGKDQSAVTFRTQSQTCANFPFNGGSNNVCLAWCKRASGIRGLRNNWRVAIGSIADLCKIWHLAHQVFGTYFARYFAAPLTICSRRLRVVANGPGRAVQVMRPAL